VWEIIRANRQKSFFLVVVMGILLLCVGYLSGELLLGPRRGPVGLVLAFILWQILTLTAYFQGKNLFMAISKAQKIDKSDHPRLFNIVEEMKIASQLPAIPEIYVIDDPSPNAFAAGRSPKTSAVAVTTGLLNQLNRDELQGVIAHEIGHIKNRDILFMTMMGVMLGAIVLLSDITLRSLFWTGGSRRRRTSSEGGGQAQVVIMIVGLILIILSPILAQIIYLAASRKREYLADASSVQFTRNPEGLASALEKISSSPIAMTAPNRVTAPMYIVNPLQKMSAISAGLFSTHPPIAQRISILRALAVGASLNTYDTSYKKILGTQSSIIPKSTLSQNLQQESQIASTGRAAPGKLESAVVSPDLSLLSALVTPQEDITSKKDRVRESTDTFWKARNYQFISCPCGVTLKVPPALKRSSVTCLRCRRSHSLIRK
jgi:heat shock protein HtpX